ncbi:(2Fe-2S)-binding protein [Sedimentibacter hydroxybenzoicus DSM 7310]|uniref:(2Fe-2S)-binding protein n=1 Tax=Sedimentibacter hydroxybenzoicus DSM 7310 TaxID=1123245 RepID=A0A974BJS2_SEDHY|nr:2Fe-2S iron-sulfur cluster-binding protein [Sedimentibacter hydroxybenzoicus]NYB74565.1 (2Fe-2S)-binding protein [Sedimentibacter hydroxybenzoicus DSM 7310]
MANVKIIIDGQKITVPNNISILEAAKKLDIEIPALCYDPNLDVVAACRLCVVEIEGSNKLETSCSTRVRDGMVIHTKSDLVVKTRKDILQLLLDSHPNDCLTCQKAGDCYLQKYAYEYGLKFRDHSGSMRPQLLDTSSPYILKDNAKCILCGKCVRTCSQVSDRMVLSFSERGYSTKIIADFDQTLEESSCVSCNRCVTVCPVGALVDKRAMGKIRAWDGASKVIKCKSCQYGCEFEIKSKGTVNVAVVAKPPANGRPLCLKGRLTTELLYVDKPEAPYRKINGQFIETNWTKMLGIEDILERIDKINAEKEREGKE